MRNLPKSLVLYFGTPIATLFIVTMTQTDRRKTMATSKAYRDGYQDGLNWDLDCYSSYEEAAQDDGWSDATIIAVGPAECARLWGVPEEEIGQTERWAKACRDYDRGVRDAIASSTHFD